MNEHEHQVQVINWARDHEHRWPDLWFLFAVANAGAGAQRGQAGKMKAEGVKPGVPDLCLPVARGGYHGLFIEMKTETSGASSEQKVWIERLRGENYYCTLAHGSVIAIQILQTYLDMLRTRVVSEELWEEIPKSMLDPDPFRPCRNAATVLPLKPCMLMEGHSGDCVPDDRPRIPKLK